MFGLGWFELIQLRITTGVYARVVPTISRFPVFNVLYLSASRPLLALASACPVLAEFSSFPCTLGR